VSTAATQAKLWYLQRASAVVLAVCVVVHLATIVYAVRGGLRAAEILARTHGNAGFALFYSVFVVACAVHVPIGVARITEEWLRMSSAGALAIGVALALVIVGAGFVAIYAVTVA